MSVKWCKSTTSHKRMCQSIVFLSLSLSHSLLNTLYFILAQLGRANESIQLYLYMLKQHYSTLGTVNLALCLYSLIVIGVPFSDLSYERFYRQCVFQLLVVARLRRRGWRWQGGRRRRRLGVRGLLAEVGLEQGWGHSSDAEDVWSWGCFREHRSIHSSRFISAQKNFITIQFRVMTPAKSNGQIGIRLPEIWLFFCLDESFVQAAAASEAATVWSEIMAENCNSASVIHCLPSFLGVPTL